MTNWTKRLVKKIVDPITYQWKNTFSCFSEEKLLLFPSLIIQIIKWFFFYVTVGVQKSLEKTTNKQGTSSSGSSTPTTPTTPTPSKLYNIQISQGDASLPDAKDVIMPQLQSLTITDNDNKNGGGGGGTATKVTSMQGRNLTITKTETVVEEDTASVSNMSSVSASTGSFISSSASTVVGRPDPSFSGLSSSSLSPLQTLTVSEGFGKDLVDNVRSR